MPRQSRGMRRLTVFVPEAADELVAEIQKLRVGTTGFEPQAADVWREALHRGLQDMLARERKATVRKRKRQTPQGT